MILNIDLPVGPHVILYLFERYNDYPYYYQRFYFLSLFPSESAYITMNVIKTVDLSFKKPVIFTGIRLVHYNSDEIDYPFRLIKYNTTDIINMNMYFCVSQTAL